MNTIGAKRWSLARLLGTLVAGALLWGIVAAACMCVGSTGRVSWPSDFEVLRLRREVVLVASLVGAALGAAGAVYQAILRNPLADPYLLGVSSGATLAGFVFHLGLLSSLAGVAQALGEQAFAFGGAVASIALVFLLATRRGRVEPVTLILVGVIVNAVNGALFLLLDALNPGFSARVGGFLAFLVGGIHTNLTLQQIRVCAALVALGWLVLLYISGELNVAAFGEGEAQALGVRIHRLRWIGLLTASLITASAVALGGPIGFVGLICPHLARLAVGHDQRRLLPAATALGASMLAIADALARLLSRESLQGTLLPVGILTGLLGGPFFLFLLWRSRRESATAVV